MSVSVILKNICSAIGEGPHWDVKSQTLLFVDINEGDVHKYTPSTGVHTKLKVDGRVGFVVPRQSGGYIIGQNNNIVHLDWSTHQTSILHQVDQNLDTRFNDAKCDPSGRLWAGTMAIEHVLGVLEPNQGSLYSLETDGSLKHRQGCVSISNGLAWSADKQTMYFVDSLPRHVYAYDFDLQSGNISNRRVIADFSLSPMDDLGGFPDGMCIDEQGKLWVACFGGSKVVRIDPNTGAVLQKVDIPAKRVTSCCFGGPDLDELYVTCCVYGADQAELDKYPLTGSLFKVTGLGVKGSPAVNYQG